MKLPKQFECLLDFADNNEIAEFLYNRLYKEDISINIKQNIINWIFNNKDVCFDRKSLTLSYARSNDFNIDFNDEFVVEYIQRFYNIDDIILWLRKCRKSLTDDAISILKSNNSEPYYKHVEVDFDKFKKSITHYRKYKAISCIHNDSINWFNCKNKITIDRIVKEQIDILKSGDKVIYPLPETQSYMKLNSL